MAEIYLIENTERAPGVVIRRWIDSSMTLDFSGGYQLQIYFDEAMPGQAPVAILWRDGRTVDYEELLPGTFFDMSRWTPFVMVLRATQLNKCGANYRAFVEFIAQDVELSA